MSSTLPVIDAVGALTSARFHLSLNVNDLARSVEFFTWLFDCQPAKWAHDYAKFEPADPALVLSLEPNRTAGGGKLNHLGFRVASSEALVEMQRRLEMHGVRSTREEGVECCYARQTKFWITDPDDNLWEIYTLEEDISHRGAGHVPRPAAPSDLTASPPMAVWVHRLGETVPAHIFADPDSVDEVFLQGTFNGLMGVEAQSRLLSESRRVLKPGGQLTLYQLSAHTALAQLSKRLPGPAAAVECVPSAEQLVEALEQAGFVDLYFEKLACDSCFAPEGVECRETRLVGYKPQVTAGGLSHEALYKGPFAQITLDYGLTLRRGVWTAVDQATSQQLAAPCQKDQFLLRSL